MVREYQRIVCPQCGRRISAWVPHFGDGSDVKIRLHNLPREHAPKAKCPASDRMLHEYRQQQMWRRPRPPRQTRRSRPRRAAPRSAPAMNDDKNIERAEVLRDWPDSPSPRSEPASLQEQIRQWLNDPDHHPDMLEYAGSEAVELLEAAAAALDAKDRDITRLMNQVGADNEQQLAEAKARVKELEGRLLKEPWCEQCGVTIRECPTCYQLFERALEPSK